MPASPDRQAPIASKFSRPKPSGSIRAWHEAHVGSVAVLLHLLPERPGGRGPFLGFQALDTLRRRGRRHAEEVVEDPLASLDRRGPRRVGRDREHAGVGQDAASRGAGQGDPAEPVADDARDAVVPGQPLVDEGVIGVEELEHAPVLAEDRLAEPLGLLEHGLAERLVEVGEQLRVGRDVLEAPGLEPLGGEVVHQGPGLLVAEHPADLLRQVVAPSQLAPGGQPEKLVVGHAAPEEVRQASGQLELVDGVDSFPPRPSPVPFRRGTGKWARSGPP